MKKGLFFIGISFLCLSILSAQEIERKTRDAVNGLAAKLNRPMEIFIEAPVLDGTDTTTNLSRHLSNKINHYATSGNMFTVVEPSRSRSAAPVRPSGNPRGIITGKYAVLGNQVEVFLELKSTSSSGVMTTIDSQKFTIPVSELKQLGIQIEPENVQAVREREKTFADLKVGSTNLENTTLPQQNQTASAAFSIKAWPNSQTGTYYDGDKLSFTVVADRDCYFKVYYISVNNDPPAMIFPFQGGPHNRLTANVPREIPGLPEPNDGYPLHEPFGTETILVVASLVQFNNIEAEYTPPGRITATAGINNIIKDTRGITQIGRGGSVVIQTTETRFNYTILPAAYTDEILRFGRPDNVRETVQAMREETIKLGGTFNGNEQQGTFFYPGVQGRYTITRDQFTISLRYTNNQLPSATRSVGRPVHSFEIDKPRNMSQAILAVKNGIEESGGIFHGNEQEGSFNVNSVGIEGRYNVLNRVNIDIMKKPVLVPKSLIEKEVKSYFSGQ